MVDMKVFPDGRLDHRHTKGNRKKAPNSRILIGVIRGDIGDPRAHEIMKTNEAPGAIDDRHPEGRQNVGEGVKPPAEA